MARSARAIAKEEMLVWARQDARLSVEEASRKVQVKPERLRSWESGAARPTVNQLRKLAAAYKRPLAIFYLPEPPKDFAPMKDCRRLPGEVAGVESAQLRYEIRRAHATRELALELFQLSEAAPPALSLAASLTEDEERVAKRFRQGLRISYDEQVSWARRHKAFSEWRSRLERCGVLVFQATGVQVAEMRGFSISQTPLPAIVVNVKDSYAGRTFTMLHELCHLALHDAGLCDLWDESDLPPEHRSLEIFCNRVAGASLVPASLLLQEDIVRGKESETVWSDEEIKFLSARYGVSRETLLRRLLICGRTTESFYREKRKEFEREYRLVRGRRAAGYAPPHVVAVSRAGRPFVRLVLSNYYEKRITASDVSDFLGVRLKHLPKIEAATMGVPLRA